MAQYNSKLDRKTSCDVLVVVGNKVSTSTLVVVLIEPDVRLGWLAAAYAVEHVCG